MRNYLLIIGILVTTCIHAQTRLVEKVTKQGDELVIPYEKYILDNGLTLIIHEDHSDPVVHVDVTYHVGSAREELNKSGFAHFFEHMMFQGSENVGDDEHFKIVSEAGGTMNGSTNRDRTNYYQTVPGNQLEVVLWLEADRMGFFLDAVTQQKFEIQRATVKNEKGQNYDNRPYGRFMELNAATLYPYGHPYSWLTIGKLEDLDRVNVEDLKKFFLRWYGPNNATLSIGGDVEPEKVVQLVEKYFGVIKKGTDVQPLKLDAPELNKDRYVSYVDNNIRFPALLFTYPTVPSFHKDEAPLDCLSEILGTGKSSYFYKSFVQTQKALQASVFHPASELAGEFTMFVIPYPGQPLSEFEKEMRMILEDFEKNGVSDEDVQKFKARMESNMINGLASVSGKVSQLASYQTIYGDANAIKKDLERYRNVTKEDVIRVFNKYVKDKFAVIQSVLPDENTSPAAPDNYEPPVSGENPFPVTDYSGLTYKRPEGDNFDRSKRPEPGVSPLVKVPDFWTKKMKNGLKAIGTYSDEIPVVSLQLSINGGHIMDSYSPEKAGLASLTASMMNEATERYTSEEFQEELFKLGSSISMSAGNDRITLSVRSLTKNIDRTLELAEELLFRPKFNESDFERLKKQQLESIKGNMKDPSSIASQVYGRLLYGDKHIYSTPISGFTETVENITLEDVKSFYRNYFSPAVSELVFVGNLQQSEVLSKVVFLEKWQQKEVKIPDLPDNTGLKGKTAIYFVDKPGAPQSEIRIGYRTDFAYDPTGEYFKTYLMNYPLGGSFNSRINMNLREDKGWTYGARSYFSSGKEPGIFTASAGVKAAATDSAVYEFVKEITDFHTKGITMEELEFMRKSIGQRDAREYETPWQKAGFLRNIVHYGLKKNYVVKQTKIISKISKEEIDGLARKNLRPEEMIIIVVGDRESNMKNLERLGYDIILIDEKGEKVE